MTRRARTPVASVHAACHANEVGARLGSLELLVHLATDALTDTFLAREPLPDGARLVTLKVLGADANAEAAARFASEARIASRLMHPHLVGVTGHGELGGLHAMAHEYVLGFSLASAREAASAAGRPLPEHVLLRVVASVCHGLHFAHELADDAGRPLRIVHRNISAASVLLGFGGEAKLTEFGLARSDDRQWRTALGRVTGNLGHMAPEQFVSSEVDRRADVFALGILLWECLTGQTLFRGSSVSEVHEAVITGRIAAPSEVAPGLSRDVDRIVLKALERPAAQRFQTAQELADALEDLLRVSGRAVDASDVAVCLAQVLGERIPRLALALRGAIAGRADEAELARLLGGRTVNAAPAPTSPAPGPARSSSPAPPPSPEDWPEDDVEVTEDATIPLESLGRTASAREAARALQSSVGRPLPPSRGTPVDGAPTVVAALPRSLAVPQVLSIEDGEDDRWNQTMARTLAPSELMELLELQASAAAPPPPPPARSAPRAASAAPATARAPRASSAAAPQGMRPPPAASSPSAQGTAPRPSRARPAVSSASSTTASPPAPASDPAGARPARPRRRPRPG
jgi:serine/threonine protein kinase